jgi:sarcosine oxidase subunit alpha
MSQTNRINITSSNDKLPEPRIDLSKKINFHFNGKKYNGYSGDTIASALLANGVSLVARSFKYGRPRGIVTSGTDEPNAIFQLGNTKATQTPNVRATEQLIFEGLECHSTSGWPNLEYHFMGIIGFFFGRILSPGFYYKIFIAPPKLWLFYEKWIRKGAGLGRSPDTPDADIYEVINQHADLLVVGGGPAGLMSALSAARTGARIILADEQNEFGGSLLGSNICIDNNPSQYWINKVVEELNEYQLKGTVVLLSNATVNGYHDHNFLTIHEGCSDHFTNQADADCVRQRLHHVRAKQVILATGALERPLVFANNDLPGCMLASSVSTYINRYSVVAGREIVIMTANDSGYNAAIDWHNAGRKVCAVVDTRPYKESSVNTKVESLGIKVIYQSAVIEAKRSLLNCRVKAALIASINSDGSAISGEVETISCDTIASSGGWNPVVHLSCHTGGRPIWNEKISGFVADQFNKDMICTGAVNGNYYLDDIFKDAEQAGLLAVKNSAFVSSSSKKLSAITCPNSDQQEESSAQAIYHIAHTRKTHLAPKQFVDFQLDVTAAGIELAVQEGYQSIEHVKRYTALGFGTDQGKMGNINGMAIVANKLNKTIAETGTTVFRPNYTPVTFGAIAGRNVNEFFDVERYTALQRWHEQAGAKFEDVGQWKRPWYYPKNGESLDEAVNRECLATRKGVGILDASTLGKIDIQGADAREFLNRIYTNAWSKLPVGRCRYGLMCGEDGMVFDDGVTACLAENHFLMTTTTGGAAHVFQWLELWHQTEWPELDVYFNSVTDHWATMTISGPKARLLLGELTDINLGPEQFKFMDWREGNVAGVPARVFRISFTGEQSYEINVPANYALEVMEKLVEHGEKYQLTPYGTETMHVLRAEKGFIIVGQDTDGSMTPNDLGMQWAVSQNKAFSFVGKRGMAREDCVRSNRKELVGLKTLDSAKVIPEGAQLVLDPHESIPMTMVGHVTSSYFSVNMNKSIAMAVVKGGLSKMGSTVYVPLVNGEVIEAEICSPVFYDPKGERQNVI